MSDDDVPTSRLARAGRMARLGARAVTGLALRRDPATLAAEAAEALAGLRGLAAKAGQLGSYLEAALGTDVPPGVREALQRLNDQTVTSPFDGIADVVREDLPEVAETILASLAPVPVASGSIAQVHRAMLPDGLAVAVKVQHPGVARAVLDELAEAGVVVGAVGAVFPGTREVFREVRTRLGDELDQRREAAWTRAFAELLHDVDDVAVPTVIDAWTGARVLTTTWCDGRSLDEATNHPDAAVRARWAEALLGTFAASTTRGLVHADPNAGNFRFRDDGTIVVLDLGCVQPVPDDGRSAFARALVHRDPHPLARLLVPSEGPALDAATHVVASLLTPFGDGGTLDGALLVRLGRDIQALKLALARGRLRVAAPWLPLVLRTWLGLLAHVVRLDATVDAARLRARAGGSAPSSGRVRSPDLPAFVAPK